MKKLVIIFISAVFLLSGCGQNKSEAQNKTIDNQEPVENDEDETYSISIDEIGLSFVIPPGWRNYLGRNIYSLAESSPVIDYNLNYYFLTDTQSEDLGEKLSATQDVDEMYMILESESKNYIKLAQFVVFEEGEKEQKEVVDLLNHYEKKFEAAPANHMAYYSLYNENYDTSGLSASEKDAFEKICSELPALNESIQTFEKQLASLSFSAENMEGQPVDESIFSEYDITMINFWGTYCNPCIEEMPDIEELYHEMKDKNVNIVGIVCDAFDEETKALAQEIIETTGATFENIIPDGQLAEYIQDSLYAVPTTIFVDSQGHFIGDPVVGAGSKERYQAEIEKRLNGEE